ncbi:hypothetical protein HMPREF0044_0576 [Gleimia coleocanis DSM 15436]|uniref:Uncharacterized protein n=1 Tax=Gleimia coleocanis DSM 15436 TaxID=525245 RepID=C0VZI6_9ACTO|nr:hypothetical protein [Gleimia coleocanis]EEH64105.1 hypothetical protein HMPREF0044_0576 [Gleimia coleocanis DSM 15436]
MKYFAKATVWPSVTPWDGYPQVAGTIAIFPAGHPESKITYFVDTAMMPGAQKLEGRSRFPNFILSPLDEQGSYEVFFFYTDMHEEEPLLALAKVEGTEVKVVERPQTPRQEEMEPVLTALLVGFADLVKQTAQTSFSQPVKASVDLAEAVVTADEVLHLPTTHAETDRLFWRHLVPAEPIYHPEIDEPIREVYREYRADHPAGYGLIYWDGKDFTTGDYWPVGETPGVHSPRKFS